MNNNGRNKRRKLDPVILADIVARIVSVAQPQKIILFGSAARGKMGPSWSLTESWETRKLAG